MRLTKVVDLGATGNAVVQELRVRDVRRLLEHLQDPKLQQTDVMALVRERLPEALDLAGDSVQLPAGIVLDDLALSECEAIALAWWELHQRFFAPLLAAVKSRTNATPPPSTAPASSSSNKGTRTSGTTAGAST